TFQRLPTAVKLNSGFLAILGARNRARIARICREITGIAGMAEKMPLSINELRRDIGAFNQLVQGSIPCPRTSGNQIIFNGLGSACGMILTPFPAS
ncbi:MAG: hypothetical protein K9M97_11505, partial [Akkermansiaceae bacterium]|nr:hypothetical protein [Akkermansiaceae bacterium]